MGIQKNRRPTIAPDSSNVPVDLSALSVGTEVDRSATEADTGLLDILGDAIYVKTITFAAGPNNSTVNTPHGITGLKALVKLEGFMTNGSFWRNVNNIEATTTASAHYAMDATNFIHVSGTGGDWSGYNGVVTLYYTKS
jgi:hypothetical protein